MEHFRDHLLWKISASIWLILLKLRFHFLCPWQSVLHISLETKVLFPENPKWEIISLFTELCWNWIICHPDSVSPIFLSSHYQQQQGGPKRFSLARLPWHLSSQELAILAQMPRNSTLENMSERKHLTAGQMQILSYPHTNGLLTLLLQRTQLSSCSWPGKWGLRRCRHSSNRHTKDNCIHLNKYSCHYQ